MYGTYEAPAVNLSGEAIAEACRTVVSAAVAAEQADVNRKRAIEDARRILGG